MSNELISNDTLVKYLDVTGQATTLSNKEKEQFIEIAKAFQLNPFKREIYMTAYGQGDKRKCSIITGYEVYLKRAESTKLLDGWNVVTSGSIAKDFMQSDLKATITIYRKDRQYPFIHEVSYVEYVQTTYDKDSGRKVPNQFWATKPHTMIKKVAMGQGFRLCFPLELGGMPYLQEEIGDREEEIIIDTPKTEQRKIEQSKEISPKRTNKFIEKIRNLRDGKIISSGKGSIPKGQVVPLSKESLSQIKENLDKEVVDGNIRPHIADRIVKRVINPLIDQFNKAESK